MSRYAVVLLNLGGPDSLGAVEPFLRNLFSDHDIFKIPFGQKLFAKLIAKARAPKVTERYKKIGGKSPLNEWTAVQRKKLERALNKDSRDFEVHVGMRYWQPAITDVAAGLSETGFEKIVLLPLYPHYSITTTGSSFREWQRSYGGPAARLVYVDHYCDNEKYIAAINQRIDETILRFPEPARDDIQIVFSAHGTPQRLVDQGDPYSSQIMKTIERVMLKRNFDRPHHLCFQSKVGPLQWLTPSTHETLTALAAEHNKQILVVPVSFVSDHIETLFELEIEYRDVAVNAGIENYVVMKGLNDSDLFISALKDITLQALNPAVT
ncbi:MAG: ferrochelatase [Desulfobacterales bacterium]|nr:ferrochelatase [Desulfobacterales bacterium]